MDEISAQSFSVNQATVAIICLHQAWLRWGNRWMSIYLKVEQNKFFVNGISENRTKKSQHKFFHLNFIIHSKKMLVVQTKKECKYIIFDQDQGKRVWENLYG